MIKRVKWLNILALISIVTLIVLPIIPRNIEKEIKKEKEITIIKVNEVKPKIKEMVKEVKYTPYRLTSYYAGDNTGSGEWVGAGLHTSQFEINDNGWYTYESKLVLAGATNECLNSQYGACSKWNTPKEDKTYYNYFDEIKVVIDGIEYEGIILDSCGASMELEENRLDLFVSNKESVIDRGYRGINSILVIE